MKRALISVSNKLGIIGFAKGLQKHGFDILSTGGTARILTENGIKVQEVSDFTGHPEMLEGRVKTLHPKIHAGLLARRDKSEHMEQLRDQNYPVIDLVVVNLYPFEQKIAQPETTFEEAVENIDIGGPTMLRSAAKNFKDVTVVVSPEDYPLVLEEMDNNAGQISLKTRYRLMQKVFQHTARYDQMISRYLDRVSITDHGPCIEEEQTFPKILMMECEKAQDLRYGENSHQRAAFYREHTDEPCVGNSRKLQGKELSYNNLIDLEAALELVKEFSEATAVIIKHTNPCGVASASSLIEAYRLAHETDPVSAFGSVLAFNMKVDSQTAEEITSTFVEAVIAPGFNNDAITVFAKKPNIRLMEVSPWKERPGHGWTFKKLVGGLLIQDRDLIDLDPDKMKIVTTRKPTQKELKALRFAWKVSKHVKSNAIVFTNENQTVGVGAGQMSRVDSTKLAIMKARLPLKGTAVGSDAFFPFRDGVDVAAEAGATAIIQPGGSLKDEEVIKAADEHGMVMIFTGIRHFLH
ncbi:MAG: bifunctional phosphoribosylaminoimidazolecarboxamide formyltransferase/IMP cyclohydrolase [bacterium]